MLIRPALETALTLEDAVTIGAPPVPTEVADVVPRLTVPAVRVPAPADCSVIEPVALSVIVPEPVAVPTATLPPITMLLPAVLVASTRN